MRFILGALMAAAVAGVAFVQPADARTRCFWNGFETVCVERHHYGIDRPGFYGSDRPYIYGSDRPYRYGYDRPYQYSRNFDRPNWWGGGY